CDFAPLYALLDCSPAHLACDEILSRLHVVQQRVADISFLWTAAQEALAKQLGGYSVTVPAKGFSGDRESILRVILGRSVGLDQHIGSRRYFHRCVFAKPVLGALPLDFATAIALD
ncbi:MAG TPA: hypothetical protein VFP77_09745, partial [Gemmatimonadaceae bacterium]|nr:hypothetical protein [Gemmatimonadaceae bacterium]